MLLLLFHTSAPIVGPDSDQYERYIRPELVATTLSTNLQSTSTSTSLTTALAPTFPRVP